MFLIFELQSNDLMNCANTIKDIKNKRKDLLEAAFFPVMKVLLKQKIYK